MPSPKTIQQIMKLMGLLGEVPGNPMTRKAVTEAMIPSMEELTAAKNALGKGSGEGKARIEARIQKLIDDFSAMEGEGFAAGRKPDKGPIPNVRKGDAPEEIRPKEDLGGDPGESASRYRWVLQRSMDELTDQWTHLHQNQTSIVEQYGEAAFEKQKNDIMRQIAKTDRELKRVTRELDETYGGSGIAAWSPEDMGDLIGRSTGKTADAAGAFWDQDYTRHARYSQEADELSQEFGRRAASGYGDYRPGSMIPPDTGMGAPIATPKYIQQRREVPDRKFRDVAQQAMGDTWSRTSGVPSRKGPTNDELEKMAAIRELTMAASKNENIRDAMGLDKGAEDANRFLEAAGQLDPIGGPFNIGWNIGQQFKGLGEGPRNLAYDKEQKINRIRLRARQSRLLKNRG